MESWNTTLDDVNAIQRQFKEAFGCHLRIDWVRKWQQEHVNSATTLENILRAVLSEDLRDCVERGSLQCVDLEEMKGRLEARYLLQVIEAVDISRPNRTRYTDETLDEEENGEFKGPKKRCLKMLLTDGESTIQGIEYRKVSDLDMVQRRAGVKVVLAGPIILRRRILVLTPETVSILGGYVHNLEEARRIAVESWNKPDRKSSETRVSRALGAIRQQFQDASASPRRASSLGNGNAARGANQRSRIAPNDLHPTSNAIASARPSCAVQENGAVSDQDKFLEDAIVLDEDLDFQLKSRDTDDKTTILIADHKKKGSAMTSDPDFAASAGERKPIPPNVPQGGVLRRESSQRQAAGKQNEVEHEFAPSIHQIPPGGECAIRIHFGSTKRDPVSRVCSTVLEDGWPRSSKDQWDAIVAGPLGAELDKSVSAKKDREFANMLSSFCAYALVYKPRNIYEPLQVRQLNVKVSKLKLIQDLIPKAFPEKQDDHNPNALDSFLTDEDICWE